jgi:RNA polymerase sigma-70 factor, ECF subfamily
VAVDVETAWLIEAQAGSQEAYACLMELLEPDIRRFVRRRIDHPDTVDDIVQDTFLKFYLSLGKIDPPQNLRPYLFRIARNCVYDDLRRMGRGEEESLDEEVVEMRVSFVATLQQPKPDDLTHWMLLGMEVRAAMDLLPAAQREALLLYSEEGLSYAEIAEVMEVSIGTVKSRLFHAKRTLVGLLKAETVALLQDEFTMPTRKKDLEGVPT